jgi:hypothetical protein
VRGVVTVDQSLDVTALPEEVARAMSGPGFEDFMTSLVSWFHGQLDPTAAADLDARRALRQDVVLGAWAPLLDLGAEELTAWMADLTRLPPATAYLSLHGTPPADGYQEWLRTRIPGALVEAAPVVTRRPLTLAGRDDGGAGPARRRSRRHRPGPPALRRLGGSRDRRWLSPTRTGILCP